MTPGPELAELHRFAMALADEADAIALRYFGAGLQPERKPDRTLVTLADTEIEELLRARIGAAYPPHAVLGEEYGESGASAWRWIVDPIDGTHNFVRTIPVFATLIGLERDGEVILGVASAPAIGWRWDAVSGGGAFASGPASARRAISVSRIGSWQQAQVLYSSLRYFEGIGVGGRVRALIRRSWRDRGLGDFWGYMLVAQGAAELMLEAGLSPWDLAAPMAIVTEAGGRLTNLRGEPTIHGPGAIASNGALHTEVVDALALVP
jgi:histidinol-phosphatase